jgi:hypothetical protein
MPKFEFQISKRDLLVLYVFLGILFFEFILLMVVIHYEQIPGLITFFIKVLKVLSPIFLGLNLILILGVVLLRGKQLLIKSWRDFIVEVLRFSIVSSTLAIIFLGLSAFLALLVVFLLKKMSGIPAIDNLITFLRQWVAESFY